MTDLQRRLFALSDPDYLVFQPRVISNLPKESFMGVRVPVLRQFAKQYEKEEDCRGFLESLPHTYYDENLLHSIILTHIRDFDDCMAAIERFLPYVNCWAITDTMNPKCFGKHKDRLMQKILSWTASEETYTCRYGVAMLMDHFLGEDFSPDQLKIPQRIESEEYYVRMIVAWYYATAMAKHWEDTLPYMEKGMLCEWTRKKAIQKAIESFRVTDEHKAQLRAMR